MSAILDVPFLDISGPGFDELSVSNQSAVIEVRHEGNLFGALRDFEVSIDGQSVGSAGRKTPGQFRVAPGLHTVEARMDWVRTQSESVYLNPGEYAVFRCGMTAFHSRVWTLAWTMLGALFALALIVKLGTWFFPGLKSFHWLLIGVCFVPCFTVLAICELIVFSRMRPSSPPGHLFRLIRHEINPEARRSD